MEFFLDLAWKQMSYSQYVQFGHPLEGFISTSRRTLLQGRWDAFLLSKATALHEEWCCTFALRWGLLEALIQKLSGWDGALWPTGSFPALNPFFSTKLTFWFYSSMDFILANPDYHGDFAALPESDYTFLELELFPLDDDPDLYLLTAGGSPPSL
ncbi:unnamed protein product [Calypogeia fissa]